MCSRLKTAQIWFSAHTSELSTCCTKYILVSFLHFVSKVFQKCRIKMGFMTVYISLCIQRPKNTFKFRSFVICAFPHHVSCACICMYEFAYIGTLVQIIKLNSFLFFLSAAAQPRKQFFWVFSHKNSVTDGGVEMSVAFIKSITKPRKNVQRILFSSDQYQRSTKE